MVGAKDGFVIPEIDREKCVECGACIKACHRLNPTFEFQKPKHTYACWTKNIADRERSSSGGAFSVIAKRIICQGGIVYGASMCDNLQVKHIGIERNEDIVRLQGSKYLQSYLGDTYKNVRNELKTGRKVLFTGTPCQVAGLLTFLHKSYDNLYTCDVVCHGVPSQKAFDAYIEKIGLKGKCKDFSFRFTKGWGFQLSRQLIAPTGRGFQSKIISPKNAYYLRAFTKGLMFSEACYSCAYARPERVSDISLADYWGLGMMKPFNHPTHKGISCLLVNRSKTRLLKPGMRQMVTGLLIDNKVRVSSKYKRDINRHIHFCKKYGGKSHFARIAPNLAYGKEWLQGRIYFVYSVEPDAAKIMLAEFDKIDWMK